MKYFSPANDTCNKCWKYQNELGVVLRLENSNIRRQVQSKCNAIGELILEQEVNVDNNSTDSSKKSQENNSNNEEVDTYDSELLQETELSPPFTRAIENIVSKFKLHVD